MSLTSSLSSALSSLAATAEQTSVISRNVARAGDPAASRKTAELVTVPGYGVRVATISRVADAALYRNVLNATSSAAGQNVLVDALKDLDQTINDTELDASPAALLQKLNDALQQYATAPHETVRAEAAVSAAKNLANALNDATGIVQGVRAKADADIASSVANINTLLSRFGELNAQIMMGTRGGADVTDYLDQRDQLVKQISEEVGVRTAVRADGDMALYTDSGVTLFDVSARQVTFQSTSAYGAATTGNAVYADGVPITGSTATMGAGSGRLQALAKVRDDIAVTYQSQLDEMARGLISAFSESDQSAVPALPDVPGLFTWTGAPALPPAGTLSPGLAGKITVNAAVDSDQGGNPLRLRDGGMNGAAYVSNPTGAASFTDRLQQLIDKLNASQAFDPAAKIGSAGTLGGFASASAAWLEDLRSKATDESDYRNTLLERSEEALNKSTGINLDEEMTLMLQLERAYQASSKLVSAVDNMLNTLMMAVG